MNNIEKKEPSKSEILGPGGWYAIHTLAIISTNLNQQQYFTEFISTFCKNFGCGKCSKHCIKYVADNPPLEYSNYLWKNEKLGMLRWSWEFHNAVNSRLEKEFFSWEETLDLYLNPPPPICKKEEEEKKQFSAVSTIKELNELLPGMMSPINKFSRHNPKIVGR
jgi:hypothetical protein